MANPADRSSRAKSTSRRTKGASSGTGGDLVQVRTHELEIVAILHQCAERVVHRARVQLVLAQNLEGAHPVDRFRDPGRLGEVELAQSVDGGDDLARQGLRHSWLPDEDDLELAFRARIANPVIEAA